MARSFLPAGLLLAGLTLLLLGRPCEAGLALGGLCGFPGEARVSGWLLLGATLIAIPLAKRWLR